MEKYLEDVRQDEKHVPDLLESIMRPTDPVLKRRVTAKFVQNDPIRVENQENQGFNFLDSGNPKFSRRRPTQPSRPVGFKQETTPQSPNKSKKMWVLSVSRRFLP